MRPAQLIAMAGLGLALIFGIGAWRNAQLAALADEHAGPEDAGSGDDDTTTSTADTINPWAAIQGYTMSSKSQSTQVQAFLAALRYSEGTARGGTDPYRVCYAYRHTIQDFSEHPAERLPGTRTPREWGGEPLDNLGPTYAGKISTAAGAYQINLPTWRDARAALHLTDFSPASQDAAAVWLLDKCGALSAIEAGDIAQACALCAGRWASLPGSTAGQGGRRLDQIAQAFTDAGGTLA